MRLVARCSERGDVVLPSCTNSVLPKQENVIYWRGMNHTDDAANSAEELKTH